MTYRDDQAGLEARRAELEGERDALQKRLDMLGEELARKKQIERELEELERRLSRTKEARRRLLDDLRVASPCDEAWSGMQGDDRVRFCLRCEKHVYDLSAMSRSEAEELVASTEGSICVRMYQRADGTLISNDCPEGAAKKRRRLKLLAAGAGALGLGAGALALFGIERRGSVRMGEMAIAVPPPTEVATTEPVEYPPTMVVVQGAAPPPKMGRVQVHTDPKPPAK